jgi:hypothetical protein
MAAIEALARLVHLDNPPSLAGYHLVVVRNMHELRHAFRRLAAACGRKLDAEITHTVRDRKRSLTRPHRPWSPQSSSLCTPLSESARPPVCPSARYQQQYHGVPRAPSASCPSVATGDDHGAQEKRRRWML